METIMFTLKKSTIQSLLGLFLLGIILIPQNAHAHCDSMDGPVVKAAQKALKTGNLDGVLIWVFADQEAEVKEAFRKTMEIRDTSEEVREVADLYFFETVVRLHRESEGATFTGLKPAGTDFGPAIPAADLAIETGNLREVYELLINKIHDGLHIYFQELNEVKNFDPADVQAGREFVEAYVKFMHYVEPLYEIANMPNSGGTFIHAH